MVEKGGGAASCSYPNHLAGRGEEREIVRNGGGGEEKWEEERNMS